MEKVLITGSNGLLGQSLLDLFLDSNDYELVAVSRGGNRYPTQKEFKYISIDLVNFDALEKVVLNEKPDYVINTAAMTHVDVCEDYKDGCDKLNVELVDRLVKLCSQLNSKLIHISTDFIFDGEQGFYKETDKPNPLSYYGESKLKSEQIITNSKIDYTILRTILVFGKVHDMSRNNIVLWVKKSLKEGKEITIVNDQFRMPTYVKTLAQACKVSVDKNVKGIFNISSNKLLSVFEIAEQIAEVFELDRTLIKPISTSTLNQKAPRPPKTGFNLEKSERELGLVFKSFKEELLLFKQDLALFVGLTFLFC